MSTSIEKQYNVDDTPCPKCGETKTESNFLYDEDTGMCLKHISTWCAGCGTELMGS